MSLGSNNQFRLIVFFPGCRKKVNDRLWRNIPLEQEMQDWYHAFLTALRAASAAMPDEWQHAVEKTIEALPSSYHSAAVHATAGGGGRSFVGHRIEPQILNAVFPILRCIINTRPEFASYRGYFFHLCGINLKLATQSIHGRESDNPLNYAFRIYGFINWCEQNPNDIVVDVGLALNLHRGSLPEELQKSTLLIRHDPLRELLRPGFQQPQRDRYCHSFVISGLRAKPLAKNRSEAGVLKIQAYHKDMVLTYRHRDKSIGANFTADEALGLGNRTKFLSEINGFQQVIEEAGSYGVRFEWRLTAWAANRMMLFDTRDILDRLFDSGAIVRESGLLHLLLTELLNTSVGLPPNCQRRGVQAGVEQGLVFNHSKAAPTGFSGSAQSRGRPSGLRVVLLAEGLDQTAGRYECNHRDGQRAIPSGERPIVRPALPAQRFAGG
jgi:hypothetical protein